MPVHLPNLSEAKLMIYSLFVPLTFIYSFAVAIVIASLAGPQWLLTEEKIPNSNRTYGVMNEEYTTKYTKSSLWILCYTQGKLL